jgi:cellulose synthase/poly-beta-1,6-N-acetylglucosamine synthase-like glycosyltransferase
MRPALPRLERSSKNTAAQFWSQHRLVRFCFIFYHTITSRSNVRNRHRDKQVAMQPLVSILIPAYNAEPWIADTLKSVLG